MRRGGARLAPYYECEDRIPASAKARVERLTADILSPSRSTTTNRNRPSSSLLDFSGGFRIRDELLNGEIFYTLREAQVLIEA